MSRPSGERLPADELPVMRAVADGEVTVGREFVARGSSERPVPLLVSAAPILTNDGARDGAVMICQEMSTVRNLQRVREEWTSIVAHELRQPISVIALRSSLLLRGQLSSEQRDTVEQIARSIHNLGRMVADLMDASLLESDRLRVMFARVDLGQLLADVVRRTPLASRRTRTHVPANARIFVNGDAQRLEQVIANLLSNAVKYAPPDTDVVVDLRVAAGQAHIQVTNAGDPIPRGRAPVHLQSLRSHAGRRREWCDGARARTLYRQRARLGPSRADLGRERPRRRHHVSRDLPPRRAAGPH